MLQDIGRRDVMKIAGVAGLASLFSGSASAERGDEPRYADRRGPVRKSNFIVQIDDIQIPGWFEVELPPSRIQKTEYREGNEPSQDRQLWGPSEYDPLVMRRGVEPATAGNSQIPGGDQPQGTKLYDWFKKVKEGKVADARKTITVEVFNEAGLQGAPVAKWVFEKAWPTAYNPPNLDASAGGEIAMEELTLAYYSYARKSP